MADLARVGSFDEAARVLAGWDLTAPRPVLVCVGGAKGLGAEHQDAVRDLLLEQVLPVLERLGAVVVDGGTQSGIMRLLGEAAVLQGARVPLIGVAAEGTVRLPNHPAPMEGAAELEPHHTGILLFPGTEWGDEVPWIDGIADRLAGSAPSATLLVNGGEITYEDAQISVRSGRPVVVVSGTGRAADTIAGALDGGREDERAAGLAASGLVRAVGLQEPAAVGALVEQVLSA